jgi:hypothetical protein
VAKVRLSTAICVGMMVLGAGCTTQPRQVTDVPRIDPPSTPLGQTVGGRCQSVADCAQAAMQAAQKSSDAAARAYLPVGTIVAWWPPVPNSSPPAGWAICDGHNQTPNLIGKFLSGVANGSEVSDGHETALGHFGEETHQHNFSGATDRPDGVRNGGKSGNDFAAMGTDHTHNYHGKTDQVSNIPPNVHVLFIMKVSE